MDPLLRQLAFYVLSELCGRIGCVPESYLLSDKFDLSVLPHASGGVADVRMGVFKGRDVAVKTLRVSAADDKTKMRKVGNQTTSSHPGSFTHPTALL